MKHVFDIQVSQRDGGLNNVVSFSLHVSGLSVDVSWKPPRFIVALKHAVTNGTPRILARFSTSLTNAIRASMFIKELNTVVSNVLHFNIRCMHTVVTNLLMRIDGLVSEFTASATVQAMRYKFKITAASALKVKQQVELSTSNFINLIYLDYIDPQGDPLDPENRNILDTFDDSTLVNLEVRAE